MLKKLEQKFRTYFPKRLAGKEQFIDHLRGLSGIEIGGPSGIFSAKGLLPIYTSVQSLDGVNFSNSTIWEGNIQEGKTYNYDGKLGFQYIRDSIDLSVIESEKYDFLLSCHSFEHIANPVKALNEWKRVIKKNGLMLFVLPHRDKTFDHYRPVTQLAHFIEDFEKGIGEEDTTHFEEIIDLHDYSMHPGSITKNELREKIYNNIQNRWAHHHTFNIHSATEFFDYNQLQLLEVRVMWSNIFLLMRKSSGNVQNDEFLSGSNPLYHNPSYPSDYDWGKQ